jgi:hypothetical protein
MMGAGLDLEIGRAGLAGEMGCPHHGDGLGLGQGRDHLDGPAAAIEEADLEFLHLIPENTGRFRPVPDLEAVFEGFLPIPPS